MNKPELDYAKNLGKQVAKGDVLFCPSCKEKSTLDYDALVDQDLSSVGDCENTLFCPHCDATILLTVSIPTIQKIQKSIKAVGSYSRAYCDEYDRFR